MSDTLERLRRLQKLRPQKKRDVALLEKAAAVLPCSPNISPAILAESLAFEQSIASQSTRLEELVPGEVIETEFGTCYLSTNVYALDAQRGAWRTGDLLAHPPALLAGAHPQFQLHSDHAFSDAAFIDTETSGLGGGASVYAFMIGIGTFERLEIGRLETKRLEIERLESGDRFQSTNLQSPISNLSISQSPVSNLRFVVRQFFMRHPGEETALLAAVAQTLANCRFTVTFNGRGFDLPLLRTRYFLNRGLVPSGDDLPPVIEEEGSHLDLLYPARRLWKRRLQSCRLINLEEQVLGLHRSGLDVPGMLIPQYYIEYMRNEDARMMQRVFYHNHEDILSMVGLATQLYRTHQAPTSQATGQSDRQSAEVVLDGFDWLALGRSYANQSQWQQAEDAYRKALEQLSDPIALQECFHYLSTLLKQLERWQEAAACWERWLTTIPADIPGNSAESLLTPYIELAKYCEWQINDLEQAEMWVSWAMHTLKSQPDSPTQAAELAHRLQRIQRKRNR